jgi:hypothetical protein
MVTITLPQSGDYVITFATASGALATNYEATLGVVHSSAQPPAAPPERVSFAPGATSASRQGSMPVGGGRKQYVLGAAAGQTMEVRVTSDNAPVRFVVAAPAGTVWEAEAYAADVYIYAKTIVLPASGDYVVTLVTPPAAPATLYTASFTIQ